MNPDVGPIRRINIQIENAGFTRPDHTFLFFKKLHAEIKH